MRKQVDVRFYAELNDFLAPWRRGGATPYAFEVSGSIKDMIETLGVPPTEVDLIMVNGEPEDFTYRLANAGVSRARHRTLRAGLRVENDYGEKRSSEHSVHRRMLYPNAVIA